MANILPFEFGRPTDIEALEDHVVLALFAAECVYGKPRTRMEASYLVDEDGESCVLRADRDAGEAAARIFTGLAARLGDAAFKVQKVAP